MLEVSKSRHIADAQERPASGADSVRRLQIVLVFQGGGALGAYQAGVYQALHKAGIEPDWIIGTSIGAINASLIAGNEPENRLDRLEEFWHRMKRKEFWGLTNWPGLADTAAYRRRGACAHERNALLRQSRDRHYGRACHGVRRVAAGLSGRAHRWRAMHVVQLLAPRLDNENHTKDIDFSPGGIRLRWEAGYADTRRALQRAPWNDACDPLEGVILHAPGPDIAPAAE